MLATVQSIKGEPENTHMRARALDPEFPMLAAGAAVELDNLIAEPSNKGTLSSVGRLAELLLQTELPRQKVAGRISLIDPISDDVFGRAVVTSNIGTWESLSTETLKEALKHVAEFLKSLPDADVAELERKDPDVLKKLRDFCITLSNYAASRRELRAGRPTSHPGRK